MAGNCWLRAIPLLLLAMTPGGRRLNYLPIQVDEASILMNAGARTFGPLTPAEAVVCTLPTLCGDQAGGQAL